MQPRLKHFGWGRPSATAAQSVVMGHEPTVHACLKRKRPPDKAEGLVVRRFPQRRCRERCNSRNVEDPVPLHEAAHCGDRQVPLLKRLHV